MLLTRITMPYLLCMSVVALLSGVLNSMGKFVESSSVSIVLNLTMMAATLIALSIGLRNDPACRHHPGLGSVCCGSPAAVAA